MLATTNSRGSIEVKKGGKAVVRIAFAGNPNSGKTTMYNALTGRNEHVGNWAGVTVERKESPVKKAIIREVRR